MSALPYFKTFPRLRLKSIRSCIYKNRQSMNGCSLRISQLQLRPAPPPPPGDTREFALFCLMDGRFPEGGGGGGSNAAGCETRQFMHAQFSTTSDSGREV